LKGTSLKSRLNGPFAWNGLKPPSGKKDFGKPKGNLKVTPSKGNRSPFLGKFQTLTPPWMEKTTLFETSIQNPQSKFQERTLTPKEIKIKGKFFLITKGMP